MGVHLGRSKSNQHDDNILFLGFPQDAAAAAPKENELTPKEKYFVFSRNHRKLVKGFHLVPHFTKGNCQRIDAIVALPFSNSISSFLQCRILEDFRSLHCRPTTTVSRIEEGHRGGTATQEALVSVSHGQPQGRFFVFQLFLSTFTVEVCTF